MAGRSENQADFDVRTVTDEEIAHFEEKGWVLIRNLIAPEVAAELLAAAKHLMGDDGEAERPVRASVDPTGQVAFTIFREYFGASLEEPRLAAFATHPMVARNVSRLLNSGLDLPMRKFTDQLQVKLPASRAEHFGGAHSGPTVYHQDLASAPVQANIAGLQLTLDSHTPDMGTMRFYEGSHKLGFIYQPDGPLTDPRLDACPLSAPLTMEPGDCTVHHWMCLHGAPENSRERPRWNFVAVYFPAHAPYTGAAQTYWPFIDELREAGEVTVGQPLEHDRVPLVFNPPDPVKKRSRGLGDYIPGSRVPLQSSS
jgi:hypothetical protein